MGRGHRSTRDRVGIGVAADPCRQDVQARRKYVNTFAVVGEVCSLVIDS